MEEDSEPLELEEEPIEDREELGKKLEPIEFLPKLLKGSGTEEKKRGRQRDKEEVRELFYWCFRAMGRIKPLRRPPLTITLWHHGLSDQMQWYYTVHYVRKDGKSHGDYIEYFYEYTSKEKEKDNPAGSRSPIDLSTRRKNSIS